MACDFKYNGRWVSEAELKKIYSSNQSTASPSTITKLKGWLDKAGVSLQSLGKEYGGNNAVTQTAEKLIQIAEGKEDVALTEESMHIYVSMTKQGNVGLFNRMMNSIASYDMFKTTMDLYKSDALYQNADGTPNILKIKEEAVGKVLAEYYLQREQPQDGIKIGQQKSWWDSIIDWIKSLLRANSNPFTEALAGQEEAIGETSNDTFLQKPDNNWELGKKFNEQIDKYGLKKVSDTSDPDDENNSSHYVVNIEGKPHKTDRTTDWAKRVNKQKGGKDYLAKASDAQKKEWARKAMQGTAGHYNLEKIVESALNDDGTLKEVGSFTIPQPIGVNSTIHQKFVQFLVGSKDKPGFLYQFEEGSKFLIEQQIYNDTFKKPIKVWDEDEKKYIDRYGRAGTIDLLVQAPDGSVKVYDWKFMGLILGKPDQSFLKRAQHALQLNDYVNTLKNAYGVKNVEAFTVPIHAEYTNVTKKGTEEVYPVLTDVVMGNTNLRDETRTPLMATVPTNQSTGNPKIDNLVAQLNKRYQKVWQKPAGDNEWNNKTEELNGLAVAIRNLQVALNFAPLSLEAVNFQNSMSKALDKYKDTKYPDMLPEEMKVMENSLLTILNAADYFSEIDKVFISQYGTEDLDQQHKNTLERLRRTSAIIDEKKESIVNKLRDIVTYVAENQGFTDYLDPEKETVGILNSVIEASSLPNNSIQLFSKINVDARSRDKVLINKELNEFESIYLPIVKKNPNVFDLIADRKSHQLVQKTDPKFYEQINEAKKNKDKAFILSNIDVAEYKKLATERINRNIERIDEKVYSTDEAENKAQRNYQKLLARMSLDISRPDFNGYEDSDFGYILSKVYKDSDHKTEDYKKLEANPDALKLWQYVHDLNERAKTLGYLDRYHSKLFLPFITKTMLQRLAASNNKLSTLKSSFTDQFTSQVNEDQGYGRKDPETGQKNKNVPVYFTVGDKEETGYSTDLLKIIPRYIQALQEFETSKNLEDLFLVMHKVEQNKGHLESDKQSGNVIFEGNAPQVFPGNTKNADFLQKQIDDAIYGITQETDTAVDKLVTKVSKGTEEEKEKRATSVKKTIMQGNMLTQQLAVGLKALVAIPNYAGAHLQSIINSGTFYRGGEYESNHFKAITSMFQGKEGNIKKGLLDLIIPLNEDTTKHKRREIAYKQSTAKWLGTWSFNDFMMSTNSLPDAAHQITNALAWLDNTMLVDGKMVNIRQYLRKNGEFLNKYKTSEAGGKSVKVTEKEFEKAVKELQDTKSLKKIAKFDDNGHLTIPGFDVNSSNMHEYRAKIVEYGRYITGQMSRDNKADYRRNIIGTSFAMFKNWIPKQIALRTLDIHKNHTLDEWEYGRTRLFFKTVNKLGLKSISGIRNIIKANPEGIRIMREVMDEKIEDYYKKTGKKLQITEEEFFDMMRKEIKSEMKELQLLLGVMSLVLAAKLGAPPDDDDKLKHNRYKTLLKTVNKISDEVAFYWNPLSAESMTRGTILPSLGILTKVEQVFQHSLIEIAAIDWETKDFNNADIREKNKTLKYWLNMFPITSQFQNELLPIINPEAAESLGIRVSSQSRPNQ